MTDTHADDTQTPRKSNSGPLILSLILAVLGGGGGFYLSWSSLILGSKPGQHATNAAEAAPLADVAFIEIDPIIISLNGSAQSSHLRFRAQLEVPSKFKADVEKLSPRVVDVLNGYLRALEVSDLEDPFALMRLRTQMLRRVEIVVGQGRINDLLIMEFVFT